MGSPTRSHLSFFVRSALIYTYRRLLKITEFIAALMDSSDYVVNKQIVKLIFSVLI